MSYGRAIFGRSERLLGDAVMERMRQTHILIFGVGGVGSWCAECLVRNGVGHLTLVDHDCVSVTNVNRQLMATTHTVGLPKVEVLRQRLLDINPEADITARAMTYGETTAQDFHLEDYDYVIDAIDQVAAKAHLMLHATQLAKAGGGKPVLFSSLGAALRLDPLRVRSGEFWQVKGDALARALRNRFKRLGQYPARKFHCVYSEEQPHPNLGATDETPEGTKQQVNGSLCQVTATFGMALAALVVQHIINKE